MAEKKQEQKETQGFEQRLNNAKETLDVLMKADITLEDSVKAYERGMNELKEAQKILEEAQIKINMIKESS